MGKGSELWKQNMNLFVSVFVRLEKLRAVNVYYKVSMEL